jgi:DNA primase
MLGGDLWGQGNTKPTKYYSEQQVRSVLDAIGVTIKAETASDFLVLCPFHNNVRTPACEVHKEKGLFICFSCGERGDIIDMVSRVNEVNVFEAGRLIDSMYNGIDIDMSSLEPEVEVEFPAEEIERLHKNCLGSAHAMAYLAHRGISMSSIRDFKIGYSEVKNMITVPVKWPSGKWCGFIGRLASTSQKEFKNSKDLPKRKTLFGLDKARRSREVFVVDASFDCILLHQHGINSVATMGGLTASQAELLNKFFAIVHIVADNNSSGAPDEASLNNYKLAKRKIKGVVTLKRLPSQYKDVGVMPSDEIRECFTDGILD